ncbi:MAG TPA: hypothetical protein VG738_15915 [Chitinophagaceae bacterium]|nr:hypothetical protein [Chitinophagaceae bacterium]
MKPIVHTLTLLIPIIFFACSKHNDVTPAPAPKPVYIKDTSALLFKAVPLSDKEVKVSFLYRAQPSNLISLLLKKDTATIGTFTINNDMNDVFSADIIYNFSEGSNYSFVVMTNAVNDTSYRYTIKNYSHVYKSAYSYKKLLSTQQNIDFDISPSRNYIFVEDDSNNVITLKRLSLISDAVDYVKPDYYCPQVRAIADDEFTISTNLYPTQTPGTDSLALATYNLTTGKTRFIDWGSSGYGRVSRVVNNHILVTNPVFTGSTVSLVNLINGSKLIYPGNLINFATVREHNYDNIYFQNQVINTANGNIFSPLSTGGDEGIEYYDNSTGLGITSTYSVIKNPADVYYTSSMAIYSGQSKVYASDTIGNREFSFPKILKELNNSIVFYQTFGYDTAFNVNKIDGYYSLNTSTKKIVLLQCDSQVNVNDFQLTDKDVISVRPDGIYRLTKQ